MAIIKCKMCGGDLTITEGATVADCEYCGSKQTIPNQDNEKKLTLFARADRLRRACEFDKAAGVYESIVAEFPEEAEAYWGLVLCRYGIEYVDDPATGKKIPTCHRSSFDSILEDTDFDQACENADAIARRLYRDEAKAIENIRKGILEVSGREAPYDIFICYKETDEKGGRTIDSVIAQDVYDALTEKGYRVFFSRISLEDKLGTEYEPYIFAALNSAKVMLAFGTDYEYFNAVWVKNEWSRFLSLIAAGQKKTLIPCYKGIDAYDMPKEFAKLQAQDMGKVGAMQDLLRGIDKIFEKDSKISVPTKETVIVQQEGGVSVDSLLKRGFMYLEESDWGNGNKYFEKALDIDPENAKAYLGKLMVDLCVKSQEELKDLREGFDANRNYQKALHFADDELKNWLKECVKIILFNQTVDKMKSAITEVDYRTAAEFFRSVSGFRDADTRAEECLAEAKNISERAAVELEVVKKYLDEQDERKDETDSSQNQETVKLEDLKHSIDYLMEKKALPIEIRLRLPMYLIIRKGIKEISMGSYWQRDKNIKEPLDWLVLTIKKGKALLVSKYCIDCKPYDTEPGDVVWESCTLREWLNNDFLKEAFASSEQKNILESPLENPDHPNGTWGGNDTIDRIFLLSPSEVECYFPSKSSRKAKSTNYTRYQAVLSDGDYDEEEKNDQISDHIFGWWLRSPGYNHSFAALVDDKGNFVDDHYTSMPHSVVRPALWVDLDIDKAREIANKKKAAFLPEQLKRKLEVVVQYLKEHKESIWLEQWPKEISKLGIEKVRNQKMIDELRSKLSGVDRALIETEKTTLQEKISQKRSERWGLEDQQYKLEDQLMTLGLFAVKEKKEIKDKIKVLDDKVSKLTKEYEEMDSVLRLKNLTSRNEEIDSILERRKDRLASIDNVQKQYSVSMEDLERAIKVLAFHNVSLVELGEWLPMRLNILGGAKEVKMGEYWQNDANTKEDIEWIVLYKEKDRALLVSKYCLECKPFNEKIEEVTWKTCTLRKWLNDFFLNTAFSNEEKERIIGTTLIEGTKDNVFLLNDEEVEKYFPSFSSRQAKATKYTEGKDPMISYNHYTCWWLRSWASGHSAAQVVTSEGKIIVQPAELKKYTVRPALWVSLKP